jgi:hypothetical protein
VAGASKTQRPQGSPPPAFQPAAGQLALNTCYCGAAACTVWRARQGAHVHTCSHHTHTAPSATTLRCEWSHTGQRTRRCRQPGSGAAAALWAHARGDQQQAQVDHLDAAAGARCSLYALCMLACLSTLCACRCPADLEEGNNVTLAGRGLGPGANVGLVGPLWGLLF